MLFRAAGQGGLATTLIETGMAFAAGSDLQIAHSTRVEGRGGRLLAGRVFYHSNSNPLFFSHYSTGTRAHAPNVYNKKEMIESTKILVIAKYVVY